MGYYRDSYFYRLYRAHSLVGATEFMPVLTIAKIGRYHRTIIPREVRKLLDVSESCGMGRVFEGNEMIIRGG